MVETGKVHPRNHNRAVSLGSNVSTSAPTPRKATFDHPSNREYGTQIICSAALRSSNFWILQDLRDAGASSQALWFIVPTDERESQVSWTGAKEHRFAGRRTSITICNEVGLNMGCISCNHQQEYLREERSASNV